jgi:hypothetical protein
MTKINKLINWIKNINSLTIPGFGIGWSSNKEKNNLIKKRVLDIKECSELIKLTEKDIVKYLESGELEGIKLEKKWLIQYKDLIKFLDEQKHKTSLKVFYNKLCNPKLWKKALEDNKELKKEIESGSYQENTFGKFLQDIIKNKS